MNDGFSLGCSSNGTSDVQSLFDVSSIICSEEEGEKLSRYVNNLSLVLLVIAGFSHEEFIQPYKARPQTSSLTANRRICAALGVKSVMSTDKTKTERQKIESARRKAPAFASANRPIALFFHALEQKIRDKEEQNTVWDGGVLPTASTT